MITMTEIQQVPAHLGFEAPEGSRSMLVSIPFSDALACNLAKRWEALEDHVKNEHGNVKIIARQLHSYTRADGYIYRIWYSRS